MMRRALAAVRQNRAGLSWIVLLAVGIALPTMPAQAHVVRAGSAAPTTPGYAVHPVAESVVAASASAARRRATTRLLAASRRLHRSVNAVLERPNDADFLRVAQARFDTADVILAIRGARAVHLNTLANRHQRLLNAEVKRLDESVAFSALLRQANAYGERVAQRAHEQDSRLPPAALGGIAANAANWYGNDALLKTALRAAKKKGPRVYEIGLKKGEDLDRRAYGLYRSISIGARRTSIPYKGSEGLRRLPDADGGFNGGLIGLRRTGETASRSPAIDIKSPELGSIKIHVRHRP